MSTDHAYVHRPQREVLLEAMLASEGGWFPVPLLVESGGIRYGARLLELRRLGWIVESRTDEASPNGKLYRIHPKKGPPQRKRVKVLLDEADVAELLERGTVSLAARVELADALGSFRHNREKL